MKDRKEWIGYGLTPENALLPLTIFYDIDYEGKDSIVVYEEDGHNLQDDISTKDDLFDAYDAFYETLNDFKTDHTVGIDEILEALK